MKKILIKIIFGLTLLPLTLSALEGYDYETGTHVEIEDGNLVREGQEIEYYDYDTGDYRHGDVESVQKSGSGAEVEVYDQESGEYRTFEMD
jgi:hypothetical protein